MLEQDGNSTWPVQELIDRVTDEVGRLGDEHGFPVAKEEHKGVSLRTRWILLNTPSLFARLENWDKHDESQVSYSLILGPGRLVDTHTQTQLLDPPDRAVVLPDDIETRPDLILSIVRNSSLVATKDAFKTMDARAKDQLKAFWKVFGWCSAEPDKVTGAQELLNNLEDAGMSWAGYVCSDTSSTEIIFGLGSRTSQGQQGGAGYAVRDMLREANDWVSINRPDRKLLVTLLQSGADGSCSNNESWNVLVEAFPNLTFKLAVVCREKAMWNERFFRIDPGSSNGWAGYDVACLAALYSQQELAEIDLQQREIHERFLTACALVNNLKIDYRFYSAKRQESGMSPEAQNKIGAMLSSPGRKSFSLGETAPRICEMCGEEPELELNLQWHRGCTHALALRCADHTLGEIEEFAVAQLGMGVQHGRYGPFACDVEGCDKICPTIKGLNSHKTMKHRVARPFACDFEGCNKTYSTLGALNYHKTRNNTTGKHQTDRPFACDFEGCNEAYSTLGVLNQHKTVNHGNDRPFACDLEGCDETYSTIWRLNYHKITKHKIDRPFVCDFEGCNEECVTIGGLNQHKTLKHGNDRPFACDFEGCDETFPSKSELKRHQKENNHGLQLFACDFEGCDKTFNKKGNMKRHAQTAHGVVTVAYFRPKGWSRS